jgi:hypothetical protein
MAKRPRFSKLGGTSVLGRRLHFESLETRALLSLTHLYPFNDGTAADWIGDADGALINGAHVVNGEVMLVNSGVTSGQSSVIQYAQLPASVLPAGNATIEVWYTVTRASNWSRVFDFGNPNGDGGDSYLFFTPLSGSSDSRVVLKPSGSAERAATSPLPASGQQMATVVVDTSAGLLRLYMSGVAKGSTPLNGANAGSAADLLVYLGRSLFSADPGFSGRINELRIYDEALPGDQIAQHAASGPTTASAAGDYDADGDVDGRDFLAWQRNDGSAIGLDIWRANYNPINEYPTSLVVHNESRTYGTLINTVATMTGRSELHITAARSAIQQSIIHLNADDSWLFVENFKPSEVISEYLSQVRVNGAAAIHGVNVRVVQYGLGSVVIPQSPTFQAFQAFSLPHFEGDSQSFGQYTYYDTPAELGAMNANLSSFTLKRGYMATIATQASGGAMSQVFVAQDEDLEVSVLPEGFDNAIRYLYVVPWRWVSKKGSSDLAPGILDASWHYNWNNSLNSTFDWEYVPIRQQRWWPGYPFNKPDATHLLGYNEPNNPVEDAYVSLGNGSVDAAIAAWPELMATGLRLGSPAVTDGGKAWLYEFMDKAIAANLRVDFIAIHNYQANHTATSLYNWLKDVYDRYNLPIWITEFNNGANWTPPDPSYAQNATAIGSFIDMFDNTPWIERYSIYSRVGTTREMTYADGSLTPAGQIYHDNASPIGYFQESYFAANTQNRSIAQLPFDGDSLDTSGYGSSGLVMGWPNYVAGQKGQAIQLDGARNYVRLTENVAHGDEFSFAGWVKWDGGANWQRIFDFGNDTNSYMFLTPSNGSNMRFAIKNGGGEQVLSSSPLPVGQWTHVAVTLGGGAAKLYVNGSLVATSAVTIKPSDFDPVQNYLGESQFTADPLFKGSLDEVLITDSVLTPAQIAGLMNNAAPVFALSTIALGPTITNVPFNGTLAGLATDSNAGDSVTYSKANGPAWLSVAADGTLSGTPPVGSQGLHEFVVTATDPRGSLDFAVLTIDVTVVPLRFEADEASLNFWIVLDDVVPKTAATPADTMQNLICDAERAPANPDGAPISVLRAATFDDVAATLGFDLLDRELADESQPSDMSLWVALDVAFASL